MNQGTVRVRITNRQSPYLGLTGNVKPQDWKADTYWVDVNLGFQQMMVSRQFLTEA